MRNNKFFYNITIIGPLVIIGSFIYDVMFAGLPYQDPTPEMAKNYSFHQNVASIIFYIGFLMFIAGAIKLFKSWFNRFKA